MNNQECVVAVLASHREARQWTDEAVAIDLLAQLGLDPQGDAAHASPIINQSTITEDEVVAAENAAKEATDKAKAAREALNNQARDQSAPDTGTAEANTGAVDKSKPDETDTSSGTGRSRSRGGA